MLSLLSIHYVVFREFLIISTLLLLISTSCIIFWERRSSICNLPTPDGSTRLWGHEKTVFLNEPGRAFRRWINELGLVFRIKAAFMAPDVLVLADPKAITYILRKKIYDYHHSRVVRPRVARLLGKGLGWVEGEEEHRKMKRLVSPSLMTENIKAMSLEVKEAVSRVLNDLVNTVENAGGKLNVNILDWTSKATLNVIGRVAFLHDFEGGNSKDARKIIDGRKKGSSPVAKYAGFITLMLLRRFPILNDLPISAIQSQGLAKSVIQSGVAREMVQRSLSLDVTEKNKGNDLLSRLLSALDEGLISNEELYEHISTFIISGHETTTHTLGYSIWELARHPIAQKRLRQELEKFGKEPTYDDFVSRLPYLDAVLKETLRLYPGLPYMERVATKHDIVPLGHPVRLKDGKEVNEICVNPGQTVLIPIIAIQRLGTVWREPDEFLPERWLEELPQQQQLPSGWSNTLAFSDGPRSCIGMRLAIFQYKVILSFLISRFSFEDPGEKITLKIASSLQPFVTDKQNEGPKLPINLHLI